jgi:hypothetical protein
MSITRRALLGTLLGLPLGVKVAQASPKIGDIMVIAHKGFSKQRIEDIGDVFVSTLERHLIFQGVRYTEKFGDPSEGSSWGSAFLIPISYSEKSLRTILNEYVMGPLSSISGNIHNNYDSKCRYYGVDIGHHQDGLVVWMAFSVMEDKPVDHNAVYTKWVSAL